MERREFVHLGLLGALGAMGPGRAAGAATDVRLSAAYMDRFLRRLDEQMEWMATAPVDGIFAAMGADPAADRTRCEALFRKALRAMHLARSFRDLPEHGRAHPAMQRRVFEGLPEMDEAAAGARDYLVHLSAADRLDLQRTIRENPDLLPRLAAHLEEEAEKVAVSPESRGQVRRLVEHLNRQMRRPAAGAVIDDYVARADRAVAEAGTVEEMTRRLEARLGAPAFMAHQQRQADLSRSWWEQPPPKDYPGAGEVYRMGDLPPQLDEEQRRRRVHRIRAGAILLGIGGEWTLVGLALSPITLGFSAVPATPGLAMLITGSVLLGLGLRKP